MSNTNPTSKEETLLRTLKYLMRHYVGQLENARDRITSLGGQCDSVEMMERGDPHLAQVREVIASVEATPVETQPVASNLVSRLRRASQVPTDIASQAADEIERLQAELTQVTTERDWTRRELDRSCQEPREAIARETAAVRGAVETAGDLSREVETLAAQLNAVWSHCRVVFYPPMDDPRGDYPLEHTNAARKDMRAIIEHRLSEITKRPAVEPSGPASLVGALQDRVHKEVGITRAAHAVKATAPPDMCAGCGRPISEHRYHPLGLACPGMEPRGAVNGSEGTTGEKR